MSKVLNVVAGLQTIGNVLNQNTVISTLANVNSLVSLKTLNNGSWSSWTKGSPAEFQGFLDIAKGKGYVLNASEATTITLDGTLMDVNDMSISTTGLTMMAFPNNNRTLGEGYTHKYKLNSAKTLENALWKAWTAGAAAGFQGFLTLSDTKGYVVNIGSVYGSVIHQGKIDKLEGIRFDTNNTTAVNGVGNEGVLLTDPNGLGSISFDKVAFDPEVPPITCFITVNGITIKLDYASEYLGQDFFVSNGGNTYRCIFPAENDYATAVTYTETVALTELELLYTSKAISATPEYKEMHITSGSTVGVVEFASEYAGDTFTLFKQDGTKVDGVFTEGSVTL